MLHLPFFLSLSLSSFSSFSIRQFIPIILPARIFRFETQASARVFDSLINYETVQSFSNVEYETDKYAAVLAKQQRASLSTAYSLAALNWVQNLIFSIGLTSVMILAAQKIAAGTMVCSSDKSWM